MSIEKMGKFIAKKRKELELTQDELGEKLFVTGKTVSRWENANYMPDLSMIVPLSEVLNVSTYELLVGEESEHDKEDTNNVETETRLLFSLSEEEKIVNYLKTFDELTYKGKFYENTKQYDHPMDTINFYSKEIDARFRVRITESNDYNKCMISYKRRGENFFDSAINSEEEVEVSVDYKDYKNLNYILEEVLKLKLIESYERYRYVFYNDDIEIVVDVYPFMIAVEIENKSASKDPQSVVLYYLNKIGFNLDDIYQLSWDDKYKELCDEQNVEYHYILTFDKEMPKFDGHYFSK